MRLVVTEEDSIWVEMARMTATKEDADRHFPLHKIVKEKEKQGQPPRYAKMNI